MVIDKLDVMGAVCLPHEADAPLVVHSDAVLALSVALERLQTVTGGRPQILDVLRGVEHTQFTARGRLDVARDSPNRPAVPDGLRRRALE